MAFTILERIRIYLEPLQLLFIFVYAFFVGVVSKLLALELATLRSLSKLQNYAFASAAIRMRDGFKQYEEEMAVPKVVSMAHGRVLEIGAGMGNQVSRFDKSKIEHIYGAERNLNFIPQLRSSADQAGLAGKYTIITGGVEHSKLLASHGVSDGSMDCVVSIQVLCSVSNPKDVIAAMYKLLKPGGELIIFEHLYATDRFHRLFQSMYQPFWKFALDGCCLNRETDKWLINAGKWEKVDLEWDKKEVNLFPRVWGRLVKARK